MPQARAAHADAPPGRSLADENAELKVRLQELEDTLDSIRRGDVDALVVNEDIYTLESAHAATHRLRQDVLGQMNDAVFAFDNDGHIIFINAAAERRYGVLASDVLGRLKSEVFTETAQPEVKRSEFAAFDAGERRKSSFAVHRLLSGSSIHVESSVSDLTNADGATMGSLAVIRDVSERRRAEIRREALSVLSDCLRDRDDPVEIAFVAASVLGEALQAGAAGYGAVDHAAERLTITRGWAESGLAPMPGLLSLHDLGDVVNGLKRGEFTVVDDARRDLRTQRLAPELEARGARAFVGLPVVEQGRLVAMMLVMDAAARHWSREDLALIQDVAERTRAVTERARHAALLRDGERRLREANDGLEAMVQERTRDLMAAEQALRQAQKMEAVGQLTGGIAHDFNNLLAGIGASLQVLKKRLKRGQLDDIDRYIGIGQDSVKRAAALTQRLLAFARRQTLDPRPTDVNRLVAGMADLIRRTTGPSVQLEVLAEPGLWPTRIDASQLENALLNLCINARDAMLPAGGRLTIATANHRLDAEGATALELAPGEYVSLSVTDHGCGMSAEVAKRIFDPFYTTKPIGQGTGLGLSMVYGFVRQSGGQVRVASEPGVGTTMSLYLPRHAGSIGADEAPRVHEAIDAGDGETVLVIEDEENIRSLLAEVLEEAGYRALTALDGQSALRVLQSAVPVHLLITDVGLPGGLNGRQIADLARVSRPGLKVLFITGYAEHAAVGDGQLEAGMAVMTKPFEIGALASKVRAMLQAV